MAQNSSPISAAPGDLLLNLRNAGNLGAPDVVADLGNVNTFLSAASAIGQTIVLNSGENPATPGYTPLFTVNDVTSGINGTPDANDPIGFSAVAIVGTTVYQSRADHSAPSQPTSTQINRASTAIGNIGTGASGGTSGYPTSVSALGGSDPIVAVPSNDHYSYQVNGETSVSVNEQITFNGALNINGPNGPVENINTGATTYSAFWKTPQSGSGSDTYEGYFTFYPTGEIDFTPANAISTPPNLSIALNQGYTVISWSNTGLFSLKQAGTIPLSGLSLAPYTVFTGSASNSVTVTSLVGNEFFVLSNP